jgi:hypothetical protein
VSNRLSSLKRFLPVPPPRKVAILSPSHFFVRAVPVTEGAAAAEVAGQVELALEVAAPFPLAQLYYGHHWKPGALHALVFAAYRKRFTAEEVENWSDAEVVLPAFATVLKESPQPATALLLSAPDSLTGVYYGDASGVPAQVRVAPIPAEATEAERVALRDTLLRSFAGTLHVIDLAGPPEFDPASDEGEFTFRAGSFSAHFDAGEIASFDVRDKAELAARRRAQARDLILWRTFVGCAAAIALAAFLELALVGAAFWQKQRQAVVERQAPVVEAIMTSQSLATRIDELSSKRLMPFEMLALLNSKRPHAIQFMRTVTSGLSTLEIEAQTSSSGDIDAFRTALNQLPECAKAEVLDQRSRDGVSTFRLVVTFKADAFKPEENPS